MTKLRFAFLLSLPLLFSLKQESASSLQHEIFRPSLTHRLSKAPSENHPSVLIKDNLNRRNVISSGILTVLAIASFPSGASAVYNPLNLKGSFWETGELYKKQDNELPLDSEDLLASLVEIAVSLDSLKSVAENEDFCELSRLLRGGAVSESRLRLRAYAAIDRIGDEGESAKAAELLLEVLRNFEVLDAAAEGATRVGKIDGGLVGTLGLAVLNPLGAANEAARISSEKRNDFARDPRLNTVSTLVDTTRSLRVFNKAVGDAIRAQKN
eukprot:CAMPEP_0194284518 /NCGR_PEP_ID=MMETSP0169-20130528/27788_1 /TAXON_ID=218684 /ORGANISM="Corethron pennatum, Strain L29A3" /LENGTH=268 /DNA_ID=CAMNT_0039030357 /DNA_START=10 /DNA_END=816 /DNA_ORIENTATION=+